MNALDYEEIKAKIEKLVPQLEELKGALNLEELKKLDKEYEHKTQAPDLWNDRQKAQKIMQKSTEIKDKINDFGRLNEMMDDAKTLLEISKDDEDESIAKEIKEMLIKIEDELKSQTLGLLFLGQYDANNAIITLHAGAGGTEAMDWVQMLFRMYARFADKKRFKIKTLDFLEGDEAGIKSISILVEGKNAYGYFKGEAGVHRLVRVSPFDSSGRRHTSFASMEVIPEINDDIEVKIEDDDIKMDVYRASGAGGQHVNKTSTAVRITHIPTGIVTACQNERSQLQNKTMALKMLKSKLIEIKEREQLEKIEDIKGEQKDIAWGSQIRSYVFMPYTMAKDHRTNYQNANINAVMDGNIDGFISAYLVYRSQNKI